MSWYLKVLKNYATFSGRASRSELWFFVLINFIMVVVLSVVEHMAGLVSDSGQGILSGIYALAVLIPGLAVQVRRLHDTGKSGWWWLLAFTCVGAIVLLIFYVQDSSPGENKYGPNPKGASA